MIREGSLEDISDGRLYTENDCVRADTGNCEGCKSVCCHGMGNTIVLEPYDVHRITQALNVDFEQLLNDSIEINYVDGIMLPNLKMKESTGSCAFLNEEKRCMIHKARPALCRLFPLGRYWEDEAHFKYILQVGQCRKEPLIKIKVRKWLDTDNLKEYNSYVVLWHRYLKRIQAAVADIRKLLSEGDMDEELAATQIKTICLYTLKTFYMAAYDGEGTFYEQFERRVHKACEAMGMDSIGG